MTIQVKGLDEVMRRLRALGPTVLLPAVARGLDRAAGVIAAEVEGRLAARGDDSDTPLVEHLQVKTAVDPNSGGGRAKIGFDSTKDERTGKPQSLKAFWVETGHRMVTHDGKEVGHVPAAPFMRPAFDAAAEQAAAVFAETIKGAVGE
jgi:hypothetical protein